MECIRLHKPHVNVSSDSEPFLIPNFPDHYGNALGRRSWRVCPVSLCNKGIMDNLGIGNKANIDEYDCLKRLDSKETDSVVNICFGSMTDFSVSKLHEIALGLEAAGQQFVWVVKKDESVEEGDESVEEGKEEWLPQGEDAREGPKYKGVGSPSADSRPQGSWWICDALWVELDSRRHLCRGAMVTWPVAGEGGEGSEESHGGKRSKGDEG
ncbi:hypothetical protein CRG98_046101 [Punica granatum]|uniref:Uncharacterized protein n=1 Tax=Punica granatum TaxID=22663 RepID=A0A2I0HPA5_PUNGR|nr:hypothetical protein CRG98_046101 [Punica granatum]